MPTSHTKRAFIVLAVLLGIAAVGAGFYLHRLNRSIPAAGAGPAHNLSSEQPSGIGQTPSLPYDILSGLPANAPAIAYVDVAALRKLQGSPLSAVLGLTNGDPQGDNDYREFVRNTGFDYTRDLDRLAIAFWPTNLGGTAPGDVPADQKVLAIADGRFDVPKIKAYALRTGKVMKSGREALYEVPGNPPVSFEFLSSGRIAIASGKNAKDLLTMPHSAALDPAVQADIARIGGAPIFGVARIDRLPGSFYASFKNSPQLERLVRSVQDLTLSGQPRGDILNITLGGQTNSVKNAIEIATLLEISRMGASMALIDPKANRQMTKAQAAFLDALVKQVKISRQERLVRLSLDITPEMLASESTSSAGASQSGTTR
ncbi:MAG TPA: hypothetical protein VNE63_11620 [Candidatus Acidoferrales bacterium]|nr:hypothetical protein [Candidatus Acidoferrales bacterium]